MTDHRKRDPKGRILPVEVWQPIETNEHWLPGVTHWMPLPKPPQGEQS